MSVHNSLIWFMDFARLERPTPSSASNGPWIEASTSGHAGSRASLTICDRIVVIASFAGAPKSPAWYNNLVANPEATVEVGSERFRVRAAVIRRGAAAIV